MLKNHQRTDFGFTLDHTWPRIIFNSSVFVNVHPEAKPLKYVPATIFDWNLLSVTILALIYIFAFKHWQKRTSITSNFIGSLLVLPKNQTTYIKFIYSEKATKFCEIFTLLLTSTNFVLTKVRWRFRKILWPSQNIWTYKYWTCTASCNYFIAV